MFYGYHLDRTIPDIAEAAYSSMPSLDATIFFYAVVDGCQSVRFFSKLNQLVLG